MQPEKPFLFIGSSTEAKGICDHFVEELGDHAHCVPWYCAPEFKERGSATTFDSLCTAANEYDFAVFLLTPDDRIQHRGKRRFVARDNVVCELGLFLSAIGPGRVLAYVQRTEDELQVPSDVQSVNMPRFEYCPNDRRKSIASIHQATRSFASTIEEEGFRKLDLRLASRWGFNIEQRELQVRLSAGSLTRARAVIGKWSIAVAARVKDPYTNIEDEPVAYSQQRSLPEHIDEDLQFRIPERDFGKTIDADNWIEGRVLLIPPGASIDCSSTIRRAVNARCRDVDSFSAKVRPDNSNPAVDP